jgi:hypothetical protein
MVMRCGHAGLPAVLATPGATSHARAAPAAPAAARATSDAATNALRLPRAHNLHEPPYARTVDRA